MQPISYVPLEHYVLYKMNASRQLFEMSLLLLLKNRVCKYNRAMHTPFVERIHSFCTEFAKGSHCIAQRIKPTFDSLFNAKFP